MERMSQNVTISSINSCCPKKADDKLVNSTSERNARRKDLGRFLGLKDERRIFRVFVFVFLPPPRRWASKERNREIV